MNILLFENSSSNKKIGVVLKRLLPNHNIYIKELAEDLSSSYYIELLTRFSEEKLKFDLYIIPVSVSSPYTEFSGLRLGLSIRLAFEFPQYSLKPIIFIGSETTQELLELSTSAQYAKILNTKGTFYCRLVLEDLKNTLSEIGSLNEKVITDSLINNLNLESLPTKGRHSIANEWGIFRIAEFLNIPESIVNRNKLAIIHDPFFRLEIIKILQRRTFPQKLIQKNLFKDSQTEDCKFLLIDDKSDLGWKSIIDFISSKLNNMNKVSDRSHFYENKDNFERDIDEIEVDIKSMDYDLIFLDLRLKASEEDKSFLTIDDIESFSGAKILKRIKTIFPALPVIIFTASQQAWNLENLYDLGADGYYIKESPDNIFSDEIFYANQKRFVDNIIELVQKGKTLKWFYNNSLNIKESLKKNNFNENIKLRIEQKLDLAFGILRAKRREYDKQFIYSDYQFAFLVYWSILIEFQAEKIGFYNGKDSDFTMNSGKILLKNDHTSIKRTHYGGNLLKWSQKFPTLKMPYFTISSGEIDVSNEKSHYKNISNLIPCYILLELGTGFSSMIDEFIYLNQIRNNLDYTHSEKDILFNEPIHTEANEDNDLEICKNMFGFVYFLLTGNQVTR